MYVDGVASRSRTVAATTGLTGNAVIAWSDAKWLHTISRARSMKSRSTGWRCRPLAYGVISSRELPCRTGSDLLTPRCNQARCSQPWWRTTAGSGLRLRETVRINKPLTLIGMPGAEIRVRMCGLLQPSGSQWLSPQSVPGLSKL